MGKKERYDWCWTTRFRTATVYALFNLKCIVYMGATDIERQAPNVFRE